MTPEELVAKKKYDELKNQPRSIFVKEVVREPRMHFFSVPKLGSYLAIELKFNHCTNEQAFDQAYKEY